jgi:hypothetical protein
MRGPGPVNKHKRGSLSADIIVKPAVFHFDKRHFYSLLDFVFSEIFI